MINPPRYSKSGYTLVEIMVAISILALLFVAGVASYSKATQRSRDGTRKSDLEQVRSALEMFRADNGSYAIQGCTIECAIDVNSSDLSELSDYLPKYPSDPDGTSQYQYYPQNIQLVSGVYKAYGYCLYAVLQLATTDELSGCTDINPTSTGDYAVKNP